MTLGARVFELGHISQIVKMHPILLKYSLLPGTNGIVMMTKEGFTRIVNFMIPGAGDLMPLRGHISHSKL